ncbi:MAG: hypothetical protein JSU07_12415 [Bacteroidetes bacterium]|nr:hypothetical protein [Bacteroidota bacterium]
MHLFKIKISRINILLVVPLLLFKLFVAQQYIYVSREGIRNVLRANIGYTNWSIIQKDSGARIANGIHLLNEVKIISAFRKKENKLAIHDAFYFDINLGLMSSKQRKMAWSSGIETESKFSKCINFGYLLLVGYRTEKWAALGGADLRWSNYAVGGTDMPGISGDLFNFNRPFLLRGEYCLSSETADYRAIATLWYDNGNKERPTYQGIRLEYPINKSARFWLFAQYTHLKALSQDNFMIKNPIISNYQQFTFGLRVGNLP